MNQTDQMNQTIQRDLTNPTSHVRRGQPALTVLLSEGRRAHSDARRLCSDKERLMCALSKGGCGVRRDHAANAIRARDHAAIIITTLSMTVSVTVNIGLVA